jgi:phosphohistidine phosphatase
MASARAIGVALARSHQVPDLVVTSSALRAQSTAFLAADTAGWGCEIRITDELYGTSAGSVLSIVKDTSPEVDRLMLVGHDPTWSTTAGVLIGGGRVRARTATAIAIDLASWESADPGRGELAWMLAPRLFTDGDWDLDS